ncbi:MAG: hypothetical protein JHC38_11125 [Thiotrichales bacterium]|jgi:hypothetical protein|nr:hypothetical protein [Thiotrichales bacterium]
MQTICNHQYSLPTQAHYQSPYLYDKHQAFLIDLSDEKVMGRLVASLKYVFHVNQGLELPFILGCPHVRIMMRLWCAGLPMS